MGQSAGHSYREHDLDRLWLPITVSEDAMIAASLSRRFGLRWGMSTKGAAELAIAVAELARNIAVHAGNGELVLVAGPLGIDVVARDRGPGGLLPRPASDEDTGSRSDKSWGNDAACLAEAVTAGELGDSVTLAAPRATGPSAVVVPTTAAAGARATSSGGGRGLGQGRAVVQRLMDEALERPRSGGGWEVSCRKRWV